MYERRYPFLVWREKNAEVINDLYGIFLKSCEKHELEIYHCDDLFREFSYYLYHHAYNGSCDTVLIQNQEDEDASLHLEEA